MQAEMNDFQDHRMCFDIPEQRSDIVAQRLLF